MHTKVTQVKQEFRARVEPLQLIAGAPPSLEVKTTSTLTSRPKRLFYFNSGSGF